MSNQFKYPECSKGEAHTGQILNLVCLQPECIKKSIICGICYDEQHRGHKIKPLKMVINNSKKYLSNLTPLSLDVQKIKTSVKETKQNLLATFTQFQNYTHESLKSIRTSIEAIFIRVIDQVQLKTGKNDQLIQAIEQIKNTTLDYDVFVNLMQKLLTGVPQQSEQEQNQVSGSQIQKAVLSIQTKVQKDLKKKQTKIKEQINNFAKILKKTADNPAIFDSKIQFKFSNQLKHNGIQVIQDKTIKSIQGYNYHFGLLEPSIQEKGNKSCKVAFYIKQNTSSWLGVGLCYKNIVTASGFTFSYSELGHGAYLISSNGGSWSSSDSSKNNTVNAFNYVKGDTVIVEYDSTNNIVSFAKKGTQQKYQLQIEIKDDDELHLCGLFYYNNDEIEYLGYYNDD